MARVSEIFNGGLLESLSRFELAVRTLTSSGLRGEQRSRRKGSGTEYADHRGYVHGDDLRRLDWHALARLDTLLIRLYAAEETLPLEIVIDTSASMDYGDPTKFVTAARVGCCITQIALLKATPALWRFAGAVTLEPVRMAARNDIGRVLRVLDAVAPAGPSGLAATLRRSAQHGPRKRSLVVLTDGYDRAELHPALRALRAAGTEVYLVFVHTTDESSPDLRGEFTFVDAESDSSTPVTVDRATLRRYGQLWAGFRTDWQDFCRQTGCALIELDNQTPIGPELFRTLAAGGLIS